MSDAAFQAIKTRVDANKDLSKKMKAVICFEITKGGQAAKIWSTYNYYNNYKLIVIFSVLPVFVKFLH